MAEVLQKSVSNNGVMWMAMLLCKLRIVEMLLMVVGTKRLRFSSGGCDAGFSLTSFVFGV